MRRRDHITALTTLSIVLLSACSNSSAGTPTPAPEITSQSPSTPTPSPSPTSTTDLAAANAEDLVHEFYRVTDVIRSDHDVPLARLKTVLVGSSLKAYQGLYKQERRAGERQTGRTRVAELAVHSVSLDNSDPEAGKVPTVVVDVCIDIREVDLVDKTGASVAYPDRPETGWERHHVANYSWDEDQESGWRVVTSETLEKKPCAAG